MNEKYTKKRYDKKKFLRLWLNPDYSKREIEQELGLTRWEGTKLERDLGLIDRQNVTALSAMSDAEIEFRKKLVRAGSLRKKRDDCEDNYRVSQPRTFHMDHSQGSVVFRLI